LQLPRAHRGTLNGGSDFRCYLEFDMQSKGIAAFPETETETETGEQLTVARTAANSK